MDAELASLGQHVAEHVVPLRAPRTDLEVVAERGIAVEQHEDARQVGLPALRAVLGDRRGRGLGEHRGPAVELLAQHAHEPHDPVDVVARDDRPDVREVGEHAQPARREVEAAPRTPRGVIPRRPRAVRSVTDLPVPPVPHARCPSVSGRHTGTCLVLGPLTPSTVRRRCVGAFVRS